MQVRALAYCYTAARCSSCFAESLVLTTLCVPFVLHPLRYIAHGTPSMTVVYVYMYIPVAVYYGPPPGSGVSKRLCVLSVVEIL